MNSLDDFDHILCVNLDRRTDRWEQAQKEFALCGITRYERVSATNAPHHGNAGCTASHRDLWRRIGRGEFGERVLIFEDDFQMLTRDALVLAGYTDDSAAMKIYDSIAADRLSDRLALMLPQVPDNWDLLYIGGGYACNPFERVSTHVVRSAGMLTTHSYAIRRNFAKLISDRLDYTHAPKSDPAECFPGPVDSVLCGFSKATAFHCFTISPRLFVQRSGSLSDLNGQVGGFPYSMTDHVHEMSV